MKTQEIENNKQAVSGACVDHIDGDPRNNAPENLRIVKQAATGGHTPGEWTACIGLAGDRYRIETRGTGNDCDPIAECRGPDRKANAQLIAAAPDLLAALKSAESLLCAIGNEARDGGGEIAYNAPYIPSILNKIVAAIAKAERRAE